MRSSPTTLQQRRRNGHVTNGNDKDNCMDLEVETGTAVTEGGGRTPTTPNATKKNQSPTTATAATRIRRRRVRRWGWLNGLGRTCFQNYKKSSVPCKAVIVSCFCMIVVVIVVLVVAVTIIVLAALQSPRIPVAHIDLQVPDEHDWPLIHIVHTRFMQEQGALEILGMARFHLFMTFCFPTMVAQSTKKWFWIIKTDPRFTTTAVFSLLLNAVKDHPNIYIVASNCNYSFGGGFRLWCWGSERGSSWRDGAEPRDILRSKVYSGNMHKLHQAMALREDRIVLETRLDADDGLHQYYLQYMQYVAISRFRGIPIKLKISEGRQSQQRKACRRG